MITATAADGAASILVNGVPTTSGLPSAPIALEIGPTEVPVVVTAADGVTRRSYLVTFDRTSADLTSLTASAGGMSPAFAPDARAYAVGPALLPSSTSLTATVLDPGATITVNAVTTLSGEASALVPLPEGMTPATVEVTARNGMTKTYAVVFTRAVGGQEAYLKASGTGSADLFGVSVAISGDTMVVGAVGEDSSATGVNGTEGDNSAADSGAAYVFVRSGTTWAQQAYLKASNTGAGAQFGDSVAISGDTVVVGAPREASNATGVNGNQSDNSAADSGAAYVFVRNGSTWSQQAYLKASNAGVGDWFGLSVAVSGDTVVVGAFQEDSGATGVNGSQSSNSAADSGAAYVFVRNSSTWSQQAYLKASNTGVGDQFGRAVAVSGDTVVIGAIGEDSNATGVDGGQTDNSMSASGAAYVFVRSGATWSQQAYLKASNTGAYDFFGYSVAISGDTVVVGADQEILDAAGTGAAYVFVRSGATWSQQAYLKASNSGGGDEFGRSVAISGDSVVVGAPSEASNATGVDGNQADNSTPRSGACYVFLRTGATWSQQAYLKASNTGGADFFGISVAVSGDRVVVGAHSEDSDADGVNGDQVDDSAVDSGAAYAFR